MNHEILVSNETLHAVKNQLATNIAALSPKVVLDTDAIGEAYGWALLFEHWPELLNEAAMSDERAFYNRYFWFKRFATLKQARDGSDAGLEQQVFQLFEQVSFDLDWTLVEQLDTEASTI